MIAIGAGGMDVAVAMGGGTYYITCPKVVKVNLTGKLQPWVAAKDVILEVLKRLSVKGGVGKVIEYCGEGVKSLSVPERATITNMGAELGATTSIFPSDETTLAFLKHRIVKKTSLLSVQIPMPYTRKKSTLISPSLFLWQLVLTAPTT